MKANEKIENRIGSDRGRFFDLRTARVMRFGLPTVFVLLYGSGFVGAKYALPYCPPFTFLALRFAVAAILITMIAWILRAPWPSTAREVAHIAVAGLLTVAMFSAGVFESINLGISPALSALVIALQPILIAMLARRVLKDKISTSQWCGLALGFVGVAFVVGQKISFKGALAVGVFMSVVGLIGVTAGNLYQKSFCAQMNVVTGGAIQSGVSALAMVVLALVFESPKIRWTPPFLAALVYMSVGVSIGALTLLYTMIRRGEISRVASIFYAVPVSAAVSSFFIFGERTDAKVVMGACTVAFGVWLVNTVPSNARASDIIHPRKIRLFPFETSIEWSDHAAQGRQGALIHEIYHCGSPCRRAALVRFTPGSSAKAHRHSSYETVLVLSGTYSDNFGAHTKGELIVYPPGSEHNWSSSQGATLFVVWDAPTEKVEANSAFRSYFCKNTR